MAEVDVINIDLLKEYRSDFETEKSDFDTLAFLQFDSSYINTCSDSYVSQMASKLSKLYGKIATGYKNINTWWSSYNSNVEELEAALSGDERNVATLEGNINWHLQSFPVLENYYLTLPGFVNGELVDFNPNYANTLTNYPPGTLVPFDANGETIMIPAELMPILQSELSKYDEMLVTSEATEVQITAELDYWKSIRLVCDQANLYSLDQYMNSARSGSEVKTDEQLTEEYYANLKALLENQGVYEISTYEELETIIATLEGQKAQMTELQYYIRQLMKSLPYECLPQCADFGEYGNYDYYKDIEFEIVQARDQTIVYLNLPEGKQDGSLNLLALAASCVIDSQFNDKCIEALSENTSDYLKSELEKAKDLLNYISVDELKIYNYLFDKEGKVVADVYLESLQDKINQRKGLVEASEFLYNLNDSGWFAQFYMVACGGTVDGLTTFFDGLKNVVGADGVKSVTQYKQLIILQVLAGQLANEDFVEQCKSAGCYDAVLEIVNANGGALSAEEVYGTITEDQGAYGKVLSSVYQFGTTFGNMLPAIVTGIIVSAVASPAVGVKVAGTLAEVSANVLMALSAGGNKANEVLINGGKGYQAIIYGILSGASEAVMQKFIGNIPGLNVNAQLALKEILSEGLEEGAQSIVDAVLNRIIMGEAIDLNELGEETFNSFIMGCLMSGVLTGGQAVIKTTAGALITLSSEQLKIILNSENAYQTFQAYVNNTGSVTTTEVNNTEPNVPLEEEYINAVSNNTTMKTFEEYLADLNIETKRFSDKMEVAEYMGDSRLYMYSIIEELQKFKSLLSPAEILNIESIYIKYQDIPVNDMDPIVMLNEIQQYLTPDVISKCVDLINNDTSFKYSDNQRAASYNYTKCGGLEINGWFNDAVDKYGRRYRDTYVDIDYIQNLISGHKVTSTTNRVFTTSDGNIVDELDSIIASGNYDDVIISYRGLRDLYNSNIKLDPNLLVIGDTFTANGYQSSAALIENSYAYNPRLNYNIVLEIYNMPNSGTSAYIENISGILKFGQLEILGKRNCDIIVVGDPYKKVINGVEKIFIPVVLR